MLVYTCNRVKNVVKFMEEEDEDMLDGEEKTDEPPPEFMSIIESEKGWQDLHVHVHTRIPPLSIKHIHEYFIQHRVKKEHVTATKPFERGYRIFEAKNVKCISIHPVSPTSVYCIVRAAVLPTQRKDRIYKTAIALYYSTSSVYHAHCTCVAGKSGTCNHVAALMFALDDFNRDIATHGNRGEASCTSTPAKWGTHAVRVPMEPMEVKDMHCVKPSLGKAAHSPCMHPADRPPPSDKQVTDLSTVLHNGGYPNLLLQQLWPPALSQTEK